VAREEKGENRIQEDTDTRGMVYMGWEREDKLKKIFLEGQKKRRRTGEKRYKKKVNQTVDGPRKRKPEKKHKGEGRY
jgi:hypothetical protein